MPQSTLFVGPLDRVLYFRTVPAFERLSSTELAAIAQHAREEFYPAGSLMLKQGEPADAVFLLIDGLVSLAQHGKPAKLLGPGEAVGFLELLARTGDGFELRVERDTLALKLDWDAQLDVCEQHFGVLLEYIRYLSLRIIGEIEGASFGGDAPPSARERLERLHFVSRVLVLERCTVLPKGATDALAELARHVTRVDWAAGAQIWRSGDPAGHFYSIVSGLARCAPTSSARREAYRGPSDILGMHETLADVPRWYDAVAAEDLTALRIEIEPFLDILEDHFDLAIEFTSLMARRVLKGGRGV